jgi:hypothetical protein
MRHGGIPDLLVLTLSKSLHDIVIAWSVDSRETAGAE